MDTGIDIDLMPAGAAMDQLVAEQVMGEPPDSSGTCSVLRVTAGRDSRGPWSPSTQDSAAYGVIAAVWTRFRLNFSHERDQSDHITHFALLVQHPRLVKATGRAETFALAVCRAALKAARRNHKATLSAPPTGPSPIKPRTVVIPGYDVTPNWSNSAVAPKKSYPERRAARRRRAEIPVSFQIDESTTAGITSDASPGGLFVRTTRPPSVGSIINARLRPRNRPPIVLRGKVVRVRAAPAVLPYPLPAGFAIRVLEAAKEYNQFLAQIDRRSTDRIS